MRKLGEEFGGERVGRNGEKYHDHDCDMQKGDDNI